ncbi:MAG: DUF6600 domain-containing protein [Chthoniobacterales bacterium]
MKSLTSVLLAAVTTLVFATPTQQARADVDVSLDFFYDELDPDGDWFYVEDYGYCWQPAAISASWRPYSDGSWVYTDVGWTWNSYEDYGWATYHYGRWANLGGRGWVWVPGYEWAPAWVSWRSGGDYVGWAPLPPEAIYRPSVGISIGFSFGIGPANYNFCRYRDFGYSNVGNHFVPYRDNVNIINETTNITNITNVNNTTIYNGGPNYDELQSRSRQSIPRAKLERVKLADKPGRGLAKPSNSLAGDRLRVVSPNVKRNENAKPKRLAERVSKKNVQDGWSNVSDQKKAARIREQVREQDRTVAQRQREPKPDNSAERTANNPRKPDDRKANAQADNQNRAQRSDGLKPFLSDRGARDDNNSRNADSDPATDRQRAERQKADERAQRQRQEDREKQARQDEKAREQRQAARQQEEPRKPTLDERNRQQQASRQPKDPRAQQQEQQRAERQQDAQRAQRQQDEQRAERQRVEARAQQQHQAERQQQARREASQRPPAQTQRPPQSQSRQPDGRGVQAQRETAERQQAQRQAQQRQAQQRQPQQRQAQAAQADEREQKERQQRQQQRQQQQYRPQQQQYRPQQQRPQSNQQQRQQQPNPYGPGGPGRPYDPTQPRR